MGLAGGGGKVVRAVRLGTAEGVRASVTTPSSRGLARWGRVAVSDAGDRCDRSRPALREDEVAPVARGGQPDCPARHAAAAPGSREMFHPYLMLGASGSLSK